MAAGFSMLLAKIVAALVWLGQLFVAVFVALWDLLRDALTWPFEQVMTLIQTALGAIDLSGISTSGLNMGTVPAEMMNLLSLLGIGTALGMIVAAIGIRLLLQLIPFTRLGS